MHEFSRVMVIIISIQYDKYYHSRVHHDADFTIQAVNMIIITIQAVNMMIINDYYSIHEVNMIIFTIQAAST